MSMFAPVIVWVAGGIVAWLAGRYHLNLDQQQLISTDIIGGISFAGTMAAGLVMHWRARNAPPPTGGKT